MPMLAEGFLARVLGKVKRGNRGDGVMVGLHENRSRTHNQLFFQCAISMGLARIYVKSRFSMF